MCLGKQDPTRSNVRFKDQNLIRNSFLNFEQIRRKGKLCDVTLIAEQQKFSAHKIVLAATIPFFDAMFLSGMSEASKREISIKGIDPAALEAFITFAYTGEIQITPANVQATLIGASFLHIDSVRNFCCRYIEERLSLENLLQVRNFATSFLCSNLVSACDKIIHENFEVLADSPVFYSLSGSELCKLLESDDLQVSSEEKVFHSIIAWCEHPPSDADAETGILGSPKLSRSLQSLASSGTSKDVVTGKFGSCDHANPRLKFLPDLLARVRLPFLSAQFIRDVVSKNAHIRADIQCRDLLDEARDLLLLPNSVPPESCSFACRPRRGQEVAGIIYAVGGYSADGDCQSIVEAYHPLIDRWEVVESMSTERSRIAVVALKGCLYAIGGLDGSSRLNTVEKFDPKTGVWQKVASMNYRRSALGAAVLNGRIYVCGGYDGVSSLRTCEVYNPDQNRWQVIPSMTECRSAGGVVALEDGRLFAIGGHNGLPIFDSVECYHRRGHHTVAPSDTSTVSPVTWSWGRVWRQVAPMLHRRCRHGVAVLRGRIFAAGGYNGCYFLRSVEVYEPAPPVHSDTGLGQWSEVAGMANPRSRVSLAASGGRLYAIGGFDGERNLNSVECFQQCENSAHHRRHHLHLTDLAYDEEREAEERMDAMKPPVRRLPRCKSRDDDDLEEWLEEGPRSLLVPPNFTGGGGGGSGNSKPTFAGDQAASASSAAREGSASTSNAHSDDWPGDLATVTTEGLDSTESLIESLTFQSAVTSTGGAGDATAPCVSPTEADNDDVFADWQWLPAMPLIAHEGGVGVGVIPLY
uniref:BTB domain-containing protein n=2 Tax=Mesocestoides corti TaxID=53468 RepID=A0A5K3FA46_MESCO